jgi:hypothetical protein
MNVGHAPFSLSSIGWFSAAWPAHCAGDLLVAEVDDGSTKNSSSEIRAQPCAAVPIEEREPKLTFVIGDPALADARDRSPAHQAGYARGRNVQQFLN